MAMVLETLPKRQSSRLSAATEVKCKCCPRPLAPHQMETGICDPCFAKLTGAQVGPRSFDESPYGWR